MDDLSEKLDRLLGSPDGMKRVEELMAAFGGAPPPAAETPVPPPTPPAGPDLGQLMRLLPLMGQMQQEDDTSALLRALRPHLKDERQKRLDEAGQMLKIMRLLPLVKEFGKGDDDSGT